MFFYASLNPETNIYQSILWLFKIQFLVLTLSLYVKSEKYCLTMMLNIKNIQKEQLVKCRYCPQNRTNAVDYITFGGTLIHFIKSFLSNGISCLDHIFIFLISSLLFLMLFGHLFHYFFISNVLFFFNLMVPEKIMAAKTKAAQTEYQVNAVQ